jgi:dihydroorotate dehydrogenase
VRGEIGSRPLCVKFAPDLSDDELAEVIAAAEGFGADGFVLTNTTLSRAGLTNTTLSRAGLTHPNAKEAGGLSGAPLRARATAVLRALRPLTKKPLIGVGGIMDASDLRERLEAGADLCQVYTGFVYGGPGFVAELLGDA